MIMTVMMMIIIIIPLYILFVVNILPCLVLSTDNNHWFASLWIFQSYYKFYKLLKLISTFRNGTYSMSRKFLWKSFWNINCRQYRQGLWLFVQFGFDFEKTLISLTMTSLTCYDILCHFSLFKLRTS